jgi:hypothetical protein
MGESADPGGRGQRLADVVVGLAIGSLIGIGLVIAAAVFYSILGMFVPGFHTGVPDILFVTGFGLPALAGAGYGWQRAGWLADPRSGASPATTRRRADVLLAAALLLAALPFLLLLLRSALR